MVTEIQKRATHHSKIIEGQFKALVGAIEDDNYCIDILTQSLAIQKSLRSLNKLVLENHMKTHVEETMSRGTKLEKEKLVEELLHIYELTNVRG